MQKTTARMSPEQNSATEPLPRIRAAAKFLFEGDRKFFIQGVTYGPFRPRESDGHHLPDEQGLRRDFALMREAGVNVVRVYHVPPRSFLDLCAEFRLRVLVTIPWEQHIEFLRDPAIRQRIVQSIEKAVGACAGHPAVLGYLVGNEIPSQMARWLGPQKVIDFVMELIERGRRLDPDALFSYAAYPPTEYLIPENADFLTYNVYLHRQIDFDRYLARLQNLAGEKPLIMGEFGMDTIRHSEDEQAEMLDWHISSVVKGGLAGTVLFSWTDEWFTGGMDIEDWAFGLVRRDRSPKKAFHTVARRFAGSGTITSRVPLEHYPRVSVVVCSYNGGKTTRACLEALGRMTYPNYEVIFVDDGSTDNTQEILEDFPDVVKIKQPNMGLSVARNTGAAAATGEIIAYTDSDCMPDEDWLYYMVNTLQSGDYAGVGGPNISPPAADWVQACVAAAPGGPTHVLTTDTVAEHIPGCNMAFYRWAFDKVGGFDPRYRKAGDDVDFCWRLQQLGGVIAFSPSAIVWHYRRFTLKAFLKQQAGYGEAESMLRFKHLVFFGPTGNAKWKGRVYGQAGFTWFPNRMTIYHGLFGGGLFQAVYPAPESELSAYVRSIEWLALSLFVFLLSIPVESLRIVPLLMIAGPFATSLTYMLNCKIESPHDTVRGRLLVAVLAFLQPIVRGWKRYYTWLRVKRTPLSVINQPEAKSKRVSLSRGSGWLTFWNESGVGRERLIEAVTQQLESSGWSYSLDTGWKRWDLQVYGNFWWIVKMRTVTEYHGGPKCLTRVRLSLKPVFTTVLFHAVTLSILLYRAIFVGRDDRWAWLAYALVTAWMAFRAFRLRRRLASLVDAVAASTGVGVHSKSGQSQREPSHNTSHESTS